MSQTTISILLLPNDYDQSIYQTALVYISEEKAIIEYFCGEDAFDEQFDGVAYFSVPSFEEEEVDCCSQVGLQHIFVVLAAEDGFCVIELPLFVVAHYSAHHFGLILIFPLNSLIKYISEIVHRELSKLKILSSSKVDILYLYHDGNGNPFIYISINGLIFFADLLFLQFGIREIADDNIVNV